MSDAKKPADAAAPPAEEKDLPTRIATLKEEVLRIEGECKSLTGSMKNKSPELAKAIKTENEILKSRLEKLQKVLYGLLVDSAKCRSLEESNQQFEAYRLIALRFFKAAEIDSEIWKNIES